MAALVGRFKAQEHQRLSVRGGDLLKAAAQMLDAEAFQPGDIEAVERLDRPDPPQPVRRELSQVLGCWYGNRQGLSTMIRTGASSAGLKFA